MRDDPAQPPRPKEASHPLLSGRTGQGALLALLPVLLALTAGCHTPTTTLQVQMQAQGPLPVETGQAAPSLRPPVILARSAWADDSPIVSRLNPMGQPWRITVHHEGMDVNDVTGVQEVAARLRTVTKAQQRPTSRGGLGAGDLAYHYCIDRAGRVWAGRSLAWQGAHAGNFAANVGNVGIVVLGNFELQKPTATQLSSLRRLLLDLCQRYGIARDNIYGHNEVKVQYGLPATCCPGKFLSSWLESFRAEPEDGHHVTH